MQPYWLKSNNLGTEEWSQQVKLFLFLRFVIVLRLSNIFRAAMRLLRLSLSGLLITFKVNCNVTLIPEGEVSLRG